MSPKTIMQWATRSVVIRIYGVSLKNPEKDLIRNPPPRPGGRVVLYINTVPQKRVQ